MGQTAPKDNSGSMEDILASIRKIITSDEPESSPVEDRSAAGPQSGDNSQASSATANSVGQNQELPAEGSLAALASRVKSGEGSSPESAATHRGAVPVTASKPFAEAPSSRPGGLAELAERVRREVGNSGPEQAVSVSPDAPTPKEPNTPHESEKSGVEAVSLSDIAAITKNTPAATSGVDNTTQKTEDAAPDIPPQSEAPTDSPAVIDKSEKAAPTATQTADLPTKQEAAFKEALVAPSTAESVNGSMNRLRQTVEDLDQARVEAVLRPLLKTWLDDNLPTLVEQLVQQEIDKLVWKA